MSTTLYEAWITRLKVSWMGLNARRIFGGFANVLGDKSYDWALQGTLEHLPVAASAPSLSLIASERQMEVALNEPSATLSAREPYASFLHDFDGSPLRLLLGLHFAGFDGATVIQQNGRSFSLTLPLPAFGGSTWDPKPNLVVANGPALASQLSSPTHGHPAIPAGTPWFQLDANPDLANRFKIIFPIWPFAALAQASFSNSDSATVTWPFAFASSSYSVLPGMPTDEVIIENDGTAQTTTGTVIRASGQWTGSVWVIAYADGVSPLNTFSVESASLLKQAIELCRPRKAYCTGVFATQSGRQWGWPTTVKWGDGGTWGGSVSQILGAF